MIVKNESSVITRLLDSLVREGKPVVDFVSILDTGSTDNTESLIYQWAKKHSIPAKVHHSPFTNFGESRTKSFQLAKSSFRSDYVLLLDSDFVLEFGDPGHLTAPCYMVKQCNEALEYWNIRLLKTSLDWKCVGVTHEYWDTGDRQMERTDAIVIRDLEDGGCKSDKFTRDTKLLLSAIKNKKLPSDLLARYYFYLAQTYRDRKMYTESIRYYKDRVNMGGYPEEIFYSIYQMGYCYQMLGQDANAIVTYLDAWQCRPSRIEPLVYVASYYRGKGKYQLGLMFALKASEVPPSTDSLFVDMRCWDYLLAFELSFLAFYGDLKELGKQSCDKVLASQAPDELKKYVAANVKFYI